MHVCWSVHCSWFGRKRKSTRSAGGGAVTAADGQDVAVYEEVVRLPAFTRKTLVLLGIAQIPLCTSRHVSTRHDTFDMSSPCILAVSSLSSSTARLDALDTSNVSCRVASSTCQVEFRLILANADVTVETNQLDSQPRLFSVPSFTRSDSVTMTT